MTTSPLTQDLIFGDASSLLSSANMLLKPAKRKDNPSRPFGSNYRRRARSPQARTRRAYVRSNGVASVFTPMRITSENSADALAGVGTPRQTPQPHPSYALPNGSIKRYDL